MLAVILMSNLDTHEFLITLHLQNQLSFSLRGWFLYLYSLLVLLLTLAL